MVPKKYHALAFVGTLVMLLLLGLQLLGLGFGSGQATARSAPQLAAARNSTQSPSSSASSQSSQVYRHPIAYDKLTGSTNNQINEVLGNQAAKLQSIGDYPIDHYQQQQIQQQLNQRQNPFDPHQLPPTPQADDLIFGPHRPPGFPPPLPPHHSMARPANRPAMQPPGLMGPPSFSMDRQPQPTTQPPPPTTVNSPLQANVGFAGDQKAATSGQQQQDSIPSASSVSDNGARAMPLAQATNATGEPLIQNQLLRDYQQQPIYYTPPIFAYNQQPDQQLRPQLDLYNPQQQQVNQAVNQVNQFAPLGPPEAPMSIDEYQARQARFGQQPQHRAPPQLNGIQQVDRYGTAAKQAQLAPVNQRLVGQAEFSQQQQQQQPNLLADPQQQARHKEQMLNRQLLFGNPYQIEPQLNTGYGNNNNNNQTSAYYPDPALYRLQGAPVRAPPYAHQIAPQSQPQVELPANSELQVNGNSAAQMLRPAVAQNRIMLPPPPPPQASAKLVASAPQNRQQQQQQQQPSSGNQQASTTHLLSAGDSSTMPLCARQALELASNSSGPNVTPVLFCNEDSEYPNREVMRALELYANERTIEQLMPQTLIQLHLAQRPTGEQSGSLSKSGLLSELARGQLIMDPMQPNVNLPPLQQTNGDGQLQQILQSGQYEPMCKSLVFLAQPKRARNLLGQWKVVVNLPGHKYRGIAISQMVRVEECSRANSECQSPNSASQSSIVLASVAARTQQQQQPAQAAQSNGNLLPKSRCLQQFENQRLVAWSHQQGLHVDIFRVPIACSCHIKR